MNGPEKSPAVDQRFERAGPIRCLTTTAWPVRCEDFTAAPGTRLEPHAHELPHICFVLDGEIVEREGRGRRRMRAGTGRLSPAGDEHLVELAPGRGLRCLILSVAPDITDTANELLPGERRYVAGSGVVDLAARLRAELRSTDDVSPVSLEMLALEATALAGDDAPPEIDRAPRWLDRLRERLHDAPRSVPTLAELARDAGVSRAHLARTFRARYGCTVGQYVRAVRLEAARRLILRTDTSLATVAYESGFADQSHMTRLVASRFGQTPGRLRAGRGAGGAPDSV